MSQEIIPGENDSGELMKEGGGRRTIKEERDHLKETILLETYLYTELKLREI